jgi:hypothetical protein
MNEKRKGIRLRKLYSLGENVMTGLDLCSGTALVQVSHPALEGKPNVNHVRARIRSSRTQRLHK